MKKHIKNGITIIVLLCMLYFAYQFYQENNFNDFIRKESNLYTADFKRDNNIKYSNQRSYKIATNEYNDAMFSKEIQVNKNTPYKVSCMVKTNQIQAEEQKTGIGAQIAIPDTTERSIALAGTNDWQKIELIFNSKNREKVEIGFRLGGYLGKAKGEVWFSDEIAYEVFGEPEDEDLNEKGEFGSLSDGFFWAKHQLIFRHHGDYNVKNLENEYQEWKNLDKKVKEDSFTHENFLLIYEWLRTHPNFWKENVHRDRVFWETSHMNLNFMDICPTSSETSGKIEWWVEGGYHVLDDTDVLYVTTYYHDIALDYI